MRSLMERINVEFTPVMNADELRAGLQAAGQQSFWYGLLIRRDAGRPGLEDDEPERQPDEADLPDPDPYPPGTPELARHCEWWPLGTAGACYAPAAGARRKTVTRTRPWR